jgi:hypothetical protein
MTILYKLRGWICYYKVVKISKYKASIVMKAIVMARHRRAKSFWFYVFGGEVSIFMNLVLLLMRRMFMEKIQ